MFVTAVMVFGMLVLSFINLILSQKRIIGNPNVTTGMIAGLMLFLESVMFSIFLYEVLMDTTQILKTNQTYVDDL